MISDTNERLSHLIFFFHFIKNMHIPIHSPRFELQLFSLELTFQKRTVNLETDAVETFQATLGRNSHAFCSSTAIYGKVNFFLPDSGRRR